MPKYYPQVKEIKKPAPILIGMFILAITLFVITQDNLTPISKNYTQEEIELIEAQTRYQQDYLSFYTGAIADISDIQQENLLQMMADNLKMQGLTDNENMQKTLMIQYQMFEWILDNRDIGERMETFDTDQFNQDQAILELDIEDALEDLRQRTVTIEQLLVTIDREDPQASIGVPLVLTESLVERLWQAAYGWDNEFKAKTHWWGPLAADYTGTLSLQITTGQVNLTLENKGHYHLEKQNQANPYNLLAYWLHFNPDAKLTYYEVTDGLAICAETQTNQLCTEEVEAQNKFYEVADIKSKLNDRPALVPATHPEEERNILIRNQGQVNYKDVQVKFLGTDNVVKMEEKIDINALSTATLITAEGQVPTIGIIQVWHQETMLYEKPYELAEFGVLI